MDKLLWLDLEMTGLNEKIHKIIEIAAVITGMDFRPLGEFHEVVFQPKEVMDQMDPWCVKTHGKSGLTDAIPNGKPLPEVEKDLLEWMDKHMDVRTNKVVLAGNSIWNDRKFIELEMPKLTEKLHYRMVDVSSFKEVFKNRYSVMFAKKNTHRAVDDVNESIRELETYLSYVHLQPVYETDE